MCQWYKMRFGHRRGKEMTYAFPFGIWDVDYQIAQLDLRTTRSGRRKVSNPVKEAWFGQRLMGIGSCRNLRT